MPRLARGPSAGLPRAYDIALEAISHGDGWVDPGSLARFVAAYQKVTQLKLGELWAIPIMLRLALIENLRRVGQRVAASTRDRERADAWADQMMAVAEQDPKSLILIVADMARSNPPMVSSFVAELARRLQGQSAALALPLTWIEQRLSELGLTIEQLVQSETQKQASAQVSISNSIGSLRLLGAMDWREFVESLSGVEQKLREDPYGIYPTMDFTTRDHYRHAVEKLAKTSRLSEIDVARKAIQLAHAAAGTAATQSNDAARAAHVGYYLIDRGLPQLKQAAEVHSSFGGSVCEVASRFPLALYLGAIALLTAALTAWLVAMAPAELPGAWLALAGALAAVCASQLAIALVNWFATLLATPHPLPRLDFSRGIPHACRTLVVVPTMLTGVENVDDLVEALEVRFLANRDEHLHFGLLTDFTDAPAETMPDDETLLLLARSRIEELNEKYAGAAADAVFPAPSGAPLEPARAAMDGLRAQTRQARRSEPVVARARAGGLFPGGRADGCVVEHQIRDYARHRHAAAARLGPRVHRRDGAPAQSPALQCGAAARDRGLLNHAAARCREPARHQPLALRAPVRGRARHRPVYARRVRRLSGSVRRGLVHRQGHLRC